VYYRIITTRSQRERLFDRLLRDLKALGFKRDPDDESLGEDINEVENVKATRLRGTIPSANARRILSNPSVQAILLKPAGARLPPSDRPLRVALALAGQLPPARQQELATALEAVLTRLGFREAVGFDRRGFKRLLGTLPAGQLETLLTDVRLSPVSWPML